MRPSALFAPTLALSLLLVGSPSLPAQGLQSARREVTAALRNLDEEPANGERLVTAIDRLGTFDEAKATQALLDAAEKCEKLTAPIALERHKVLRAGGSSGRLKRTRYALRNLDDGAEAIGKALRGQRSADAVTVMVRRLCERSTGLPLWLRLELAARAAELPEDRFDWRPPGKKKVPDDTLLGVLGAMAVLGRRAGETKTASWITAQLAHENPDVRVAASRALGKLASPAGIEALIARLDHEQGEVREAVLDALVVLTAANPGDAAGSWRAWLAAEGAPYLAGKMPLSRGDASKRERKPPEHTVSGSYFGIEQDGESILYVFDNSNSMKARLGGKGKDPVTGGAPQTRWQLCQQELKQALLALPPTKRFGLVAFANRIRIFEPSVVPATKENVARAIVWLFSLQLEFETNVFDALELAFVMSGRGAGDRYYRPDVDTIFFLSDGAPTIPNLDKPGIRRDDSDRILAAVRRWNALGKIKVHTIGLGLQNRKKERNDKGQLWPPVFLRKLAEQNGGKYTSRRK